MKGDSGRTVDFALKSSSALFLTKDSVVKVADQEIPNIIGVEISVEPGHEARVVLRAQIWEALDLAFPADVAIQFVGLDSREEIVEEPLAGGGRRFYARPRRDR